MVNAIKPNDQCKIEAAVVMMAILYLVFELAFNARLLDLSGGHATPADLQGIETVGRLISGVGCGLLLWNLAKRLAGYKALAFSAIMLTSIIGVFLLQEWVVKEIISSASPEKRRQAVYLSLLSHATQSNAVAIDGLELSANEYGTAVGKTFFALLPLSGYLSPVLLRNLEAALPAIIENAARQKLGSPEKLYNEMYVPFANTWRNFYNEKYVPLSQNMTISMLSQEARVEQAWINYLAELDRHRISASRAPEQARLKVVKKLNAQGIPVDSSWQLDDYDGFAKAIASTSMSEADFKKTVSKALGFESQIPPSLSWAKFATHPDVLHKARSSFSENYPEQQFSSLLSLNWTFEEFKKNFYSMTVKTASHRTTKTVTADVSNFSPEGAHAQLADQAMQAVVVPPVALGFSLVFGILNLVHLSTRLLMLRLMSAIAFKGLALSLLVALPLLINNAATDSRLFNSMASAVGEKHGVIAQESLRWLINAEPHFYTVTHRVHQCFLGGWKFRL